MNDFDIMPPGSEWVLFLTWHEQLNAFMVAHDVDGAFQIQGGTIATRGWGAFAREWNGKPATAFLTVLERADPNLRFGLRRRGNRDDHSVVRRHVAASTRPPAVTRELEYLDRLSVKTQ